MSRMKSVSTALLSLTLFAGSAAAQTPPAQTPPKPQTPPATAPAPKLPAAAAAAPAPAVPLPEGAKVGLIDLQRVADESAAGKAAIAQVKVLFDKKSAELQTLQTQIQALQQKKQTQSSVMSPAAAAQTDKDIERLQLELQYKQTGAEKEVNDLRNELMGDFVQKVAPVVEAFAKEKGLQAVLDIGSNAVFFAVPGMDISADIVKRLDAVVKK